MRCAACGASNDAGRAYCGGCAHSLGTFCAVCQFLNGEGVRYCGGCARDLCAAVAEPAPPATAVSVPTPAARMLPTRSLAAAFDDLGDLRCQPSPTVGGESLQPAPALGDEVPQPVTAADTTQDEIDGFFQRLVKEGVAELRSSGVSTAPPGSPRSAPS